LTLTLVRAALAALHAGELQALQEAADVNVDASPGLFAWLEHIVAWELDRRAGHDYALRFPIEAVEPADMPEAIAIVQSLHDTFDAREASPQMLDLLTAVAHALRNAESLH
jgi:hypothetical protein